jgi:hypothetical protein
MNIGFYLENTANEKQMSEICNAITRAFSDKIIKDAAIFFDDATPCNVKVPCATFNSCDLWSFHGKLVTCSYNTLIKAMQIVNNIDIYYYYEVGKINTISLLLLEDIETVCNGDYAKSNFKRLTNSDPLGVSINYNNIIEVIS